MCKTWIFKNPENGFDIRPLTICRTETETWETSDYDIIVYTLYDKNWLSFSNFKICSTFWPGEVIDDLMSMWHIVHN